MKLGITAVVLAACLCGCSRSESVDPEPILAIVGDRAVQTESNIKRLGLPRKSVTNILQLVASVNAVNRADGQSREATWLPYLRVELQRRIKDKIITVELAECVVFAMTPITRYFDSMESKHPDWDMNQFERAYFSRFDKLK